MTQRQVERFLHKLEGPQGIHIRHDDQQRIVWTCAGGNDQSLARRILARMRIPEAEAESFLLLCHELGGHCDCEILYNAGPRLQADYERQGVR